MIKYLFTKNGFVYLFASLAAVSWAFAFPLIKIGLEAFEISGTDTGSKTLFAGVRFMLAGILTLIIAKIFKRDFKIKGKSDLALIAAFALVNTALHYFFFYIGVSNSEGSRSAIIDSLGTFFLIILACIIFKDERFTLQKFIGCICGFGGILFINIGSSDIFSAFSFSGDGMLILSAVCAAFGGILTRIVTRRCDALVATGLSLGLGGLMLILTGVFMGGSFPVIKINGILILLALVLVSSVGFSLYNQLICYNPVGEIVIFNSFIPIIGAVLSCLMLGEEFSYKYIVAGVLVALGVYIVNKKGTKSHSDVK